MALIVSVMLQVPALADDLQDVRVDGRGWGHGVGMSQYGAHGQATEGKSGAEIVGYYYEGTTVASLTDLLDDDHLVAGENPLWVALPGLQAKTRFTFKPINGPLEVCHSGDGEGPCPKQSVQPQAGESWSFEVVDAGRCQFFLDGVATGTDGGCRAALAWEEGTRIDVNGKQYARGEIKVRPVPGSNAFHVSLALGLEEYMYGLAEVPTGWPKGALQAQALAGRSYAAFRFLQHEDPALRTDADAGLNTTRRAACWCHMYSTTIDQAYVGYSHELNALWKRWRNAVNQTAGEVVSHDDPGHTLQGVAQAFYSSSTGGATENSEDKWVATVPYLRSKPDPWSLNEVNPYAAWHIHRSPESFAAALGLDEVYTAEIVETYESGSPKRIVIEGSDNGSPATREYTGSEFRSKFGMRSHYITDIAADFGPPPPPPPDPTEKCNGLVATIIGTDGDDLLVGTPGDDVIVGLAGDDRIVGAGGNDTICGDAGNDTLIGKGGDDFLHGGPGRDTASYASAPASVAVSLANGTATGGAGNDVLAAIENVAGSRFDDFLVGNAKKNRLQGLEGDDELRGKGAADVLRGGPGRDRLIGATGNDVIDGGPGRDTASFVAAAGPVTVNLALGVSSGADGADTVVRIRDVIGSNHADDLIGTNAGNAIWGRSGDDTISGRAGDDQIRGGGGTDEADGGDGEDLCRAETQVACEL